MIIILFTRGYSNPDLTYGVTTTHLPPAAPPNRGGGEGRILADQGEEERTRHSIRSIDSGLGESDDPTQVDRDSMVEVYIILITLCSPKLVKYLILYW